MTAEWLAKLGRSSANNGPKNGTRDSGIAPGAGVAGIGSFAVRAKALAKRFATGRADYGTLVPRGFEVGAACLVILVGVALLTGLMASAQLGFF